MNESALYKLTYGLYVISTTNNGTDAGCVANTLHQVTSSPIQLSITLNKENYTQQMIAQSRMFNASVLTQEVDMDVIRTFGFQSSKDHNKYANIAFTRDEQGIPYLKDHSAAYVTCKVVKQLDLGTHVMFIGEVVNADVLASEEVMTYAYYHMVKNGATPKNAPSYQANTDKKGWRCSICGYIYEGDPLPEDYICPICNAPASMFEKLGGKYMKMKDKVVLITGGGKGIGRGIVEAFAEEGANLIITGRQTSALETAKQELQQKYGIQVLAISADGSVEADVKRVMEEVKKTYQRLDVIINNAMASKSGTMLIDHSTSDFDLAIQTGLYATFFYMREAYPLLKESKGSVINFASGAGLGGRIGQSSYAAAKEGIRGLSRVAATEWGPDGINVNIVCPLVETPQMLKWKEEHPDHYAKTIQGIPLQRFGDAKKDVGRTCVFLASDDASFISGETIVLQGGSGLRP